MTGPKIAVMCETTIGYGTPQVPTFSTALAEHFQTRPIVFSPYDEIRPMRELYPKIDIEVIPLHSKRYLPPGRAEYVIRSAKRIDEIKPDLLVAFCTYTLPVLRRMRHRPKKIVYYSLESLSNYPRSELYINRKLAPMIDVVIYPEFNRAALDGGRGHMLGRPVVVMVNNVHPSSTSDRVLPAEKRNGRIIHPGSIAYEVTFAEYFLDERSQGYPLDILGLLYGQKLKDEIGGMKRNVRYLGVVDEKKLADLRKDYSWGIVIWNPNTENGRLAAPNKLFDYLASGVPAISAPHPQAAEIIAKYGCGLLMPDWTYESFMSTIDEALLISRSGRYQTYVDACVRAHREELSWDHQFAKFLTAFEAVGGLA
ncbi:MAG: glycosyltransferase [Fimbriimonas ginsengisoli]|uniref:Glycosyltransferase n=1 Tax=Fimbriimonas ginsengisoli TaxID=1005039 RepID=A0A931LVB0_FIMGI|nr:glycosyltransferase [Fimbriimonas ginsengisoli]